MEAVVVNAKMRNWVFVKVVTDTDGLVGWGEATTEWKTRAVVGAVDDLAPLLVGADPFRIEHLWQLMHRGQFFHGGLVVSSALSGIDQALHDIKAKALGVPVYDLLGGAVRDRIRLYDHLGGGDSDVVYRPPDPERFAEAAQRSVADGFTAVKVLAVAPAAALPPAALVRQAVAVMTAIRESVGDDIEVMVDLHGRTSVAGAVQIGHALTPLRPWFLEEPCQPSNVDGILAVMRALPVPIATGERLVGRAEFRPLLDGGIAVIQPDVCHCGGLSEMRRIAAAAETHGAVVAPHNPLGPIATAVNLHFAATTPNWLIQEQMRNDVPWRDEVVSHPFSPVDGYVPLPDGPGLGLDVDERAAARYPYKPEPQIGAALDDGAVADW